MTDKPQPLCVDCKEPFVHAEGEVCRWCEIRRSRRRHRTSTRDNAKVINLVADGPHVLRRTIVTDLRVSPCESTPNWFDMTLTVRVIKDGATFYDRPEDHTFQQTIRELDAYQFARYAFNKLDVLGRPPYLDVTFVRSPFGPLEVVGLYNTDTKESWGDCVGVSECST